MAGRTSEKGNTTGKTIFCFIGKVIGAGITAFAILALFCVFYYNPPVHEPCGNGVTSYVRQADTFWARGTEGFAMGTTDDSGYNNSYPADGRKTAILMMGSSQTEGLYVNENDCVSYLLMRNTPKMEATGMYTTWECQPIPFTVISVIWKMPLRFIGLLNMLR